MEDFPIIGINGPSNSGKDLVADWFVDRHDFSKVAFADPIKRIARMLFAYNFEVMWGPASKREEQYTYSDTDWYKISERFSRVANDTTTALIPPGGGRVAAFQELVSWFSSLREMHKKEGSLMARVVLQTLGTEWGRDKVNKFLWIDFLYKEIAPKLQAGLHYTQDKGLVGNNVKSQYKGIIIPDHRFLNEIQRTQELGGYCIRIKRLAKLSENRNSNTGIDGHASEIEMRTIPDSAFDLVIELPEGPEAVYRRMQEIFEAKAWETKRRTSDTPSPGTG